MSERENTSPSWESHSPADMRLSHSSRDTSRHSWRSDGGFCLLGSGAGGRGLELVELVELVVRDVARRMRREAMEEAVDPSLRVHIPHARRHDAYMYGRLLSHSPASAHPAQLS